MIHFSECPREKKKRGVILKDVTFTLKILLPTCLLLVALESPQASAMLGRRVARSLHLVSLDPIVASVAKTLQVVAASKKTSMTTACYVAHQEDHQEIKDDDHHHHHHHPDPNFLLNVLVLVLRSLKPVALVAPQTPIFGRFNQLSGTNLGR